MAILNGSGPRAFAALVAVGIAVVAGCGNSGLPSGAISKAAGTRALTVAGNPGTGTGGGTGGGGGGGASSLRLVGWDLNKVLPTGGTTPVVWLFGQTGTGATIPGLLLHINGSAAPTSITVNQTASGGIFINLGALNPAPVNGDKYKLVNGTSVSNEVTVNTAAFATANTGAGGFVMSAPVDGSSTNAPATPLTFTSAGTGVVSYNPVVLTLDPTAGQITKINVSAEMSSAGTFTAGSSAGTTGVFANESLAPLTGSLTYATHVVGLDGSGWGIGTTVDIAGFNAGSTSGLASWVWFTTQ